MFAGREKGGVRKGPSKKHAMRNILLCLMWLLGLSSCSHDIENGLDTSPRSYRDKMTLIPSDTLVILMGDRSNIYSRYVKACQINGNPYLGIVNESTNELEFYSLADAKGNFKVSFQKDGPNGIGQLKGFELESDSTLFIGSTLRTRIYKTDLLGNVKAIVTTLNENRAFIQKYSTINPLIHDTKRGGLIAFINNDADYNVPGFWSGKAFMKIRFFDEKEPLEFFFKLPKDLSQYVHGAFFSHSSHVLAGGRHLILGLPFYNDLFIYDMDSGSLKQSPAGSKHFGDAMPWDNPTSGMSESFYVPSNSYREMAYDEGAELLYRIAYQGVDYIGTDGLRRNWDNKLPSIIILDKGFEKVGEVDLSQNTYDTRSFFT